MLALAHIHNMRSVASELAILFSTVFLLTNYFILYASSLVYIGQKGVVNFYGGVFDVSSWLRLYNLYQNYLIPNATIHYTIRRGMQQNRIYPALFSIYRQ